MRVGSNPVNTICPKLVVATPVGAKAPHVVDAHCRKFASVLKSIKSCTSG
nr:hypothetical protein [Bacillus mobilis]